MPTPASLASNAIASELELPVERRHSAGNVYTNVRRRSVEKPPRRWRTILLAVGHGLAASVLLAAGTLFTLHQQHPTYVKPLEVLQLPAAVVEATSATEQTFRVSQVLRKYTKDSTRANRIATAIVSEGQKKNLDPALLIGILLTENAKLDPLARSNVSARGLMQVMPFHAGKWKECPSRDLADVESNICYGTSILAQYIKKSPSLERALLRYNGCVRGTNTPRCHTYSGKVLKYADQAASAMLKVPFIDSE
ncbi:MAG TPA: lytic transglycosylase domain-containing protein [Gemmatimonadaceae bacterium]|jgi:soluble lytic murein transglycosylase-like protein